MSVEEYPINNAVTGVQAMNLAVSGGTSAVINSAITGRPLYNMPSFPYGGGSSVLVKKALTDPAAIACENGVAYTYTPDATTAFAFATSGLSASECPVFELWITEPAELKTISFPNTVKWNDGEGNYDAANDPPIPDEAGKIYRYIFQWVGNAILGELAGRW